MQRELAETHRHDSGLTPAGNIRTLLLRRAAGVKNGGIPSLHAWMQRALRDRTEGHYLGALEEMRLARYLASADSKTGYLTGTSPQWVSREAIRRAATKNSKRNALGRPLPHLAL